MAQRLTGKFRRRKDSTSRQLRRRRRQRGTSARLDRRGSLLLGLPIFKGPAATVVHPRLLAGLADVRSGGEAPRRSSGRLGSFHRPVDDDAGESGSGNKSLRRPSARLRRFHCTATAGATWFDGRRGARGIDLPSTSSVSYLSRKC